MENCPECVARDEHIDAMNKIFEGAMKEDRLNQRKWDYRFLEMAKLVSTSSKDPSTKAGAVIVGKNRQVVSTGYNGFARGVDDSPERYANRDLKIATICHCEINAIIFADRHQLKGATLYTYPFGPCSNCSSVVIQAGIKRCVAPIMPEDKKVRWKESMDLAEKQFTQVGVKLELIPFE